MAKEEDILNPCGHRNSERIEALKKLPSSICPACLFERIKKLEAKSIDCPNRPASKTEVEMAKRLCDYQDEVYKLKAENKKLKNQKEYIYKKELAQLKNTITDAIELMDDEPAKKILEQALKGGK